MATAKHDHSALASLYATAAQRLDATDLRALIVHQSVWLQTTICPAAYIKRTRRFLNHLLKAA